MKNRTNFQEGFCCSTEVEAAWAALRSLAMDVWDSFLLVELGLLWHIAAQVVWCPVTTSISWELWQVRKYKVLSLIYCCYCYCVVVGRWGSFSFVRPFVHQLKFIMIFFVVMIFNLNFEFLRPKKWLTGPSKSTFFSGVSFSMRFWSSPSTRVLSLK